MNPESNDKAADGPNCQRRLVLGTELIEAERRRQIEGEGWSPEHDDEHNKGELAQVARDYVQEAFMQVKHGMPADKSIVPSRWPWDEKWWKPSEDPIRNLVKAGALIAAEIDRLQRARSSENTEECQEGERR